MLGVRGRRPPARARTRCSQAVDVLVQIRRYRLPKRIEDEVYSFSAGELGSRHEVGISRHQDDLIYLALEGECSDVKTNPHVDTLLPNLEEYVRVGQIGNRYLAV